MSMEPSDVPDASATVLYVGNLDKRVTDSVMLNILRTGLPHIADKILSARMFGSADITQGPEGFCFIQFGDNNAACQAMTFLNGRNFCDKTVKVNWATNSNSKDGIPKVIGTSVTIFVGDLDDDLSDSELRQAFEPFGEILNAKVVRDAATDKSKNYGFISFTNKPDAEKAIRDMHGAMLKRRPIKTNWATRNQNTKPNQLDYDQVAKEASEENTTVYVTNLPDRVSEDVLIKHFEDCGKITGNPRVFDGKNFAFIKFANHDDATKAIVKGNGSELYGSILKCWWGKDSDNHHHHSNNKHNNHSSQSSQPQLASFQPTGIESTQLQQQQQQQQMQQYMYNQYYQQQYYQYWMQQYQQQQQQQPGGAPQQPMPQQPQQPPAQQQQQPGYNYQQQQQQQQPPQQQQGYPAQQQQGYPPQQSQGYQQNHH